MNDWKKYRRTNIAEMRPVTQHEVDCNDALVDNGISISEVDINNGSPLMGDMIARNPQNHKDQWLVAKKYFKENFESIN